MRNEPRTQEPPELKVEVVADPAGRQDAWMARQGDFLIVREAIPKDAVRLPNQDEARVLAHSPTTGHMHVVSGGEFFEARVNGEPRKFFRLQQPEVLSHDEHDPIQIPPGEYVVERQREYVPGRLHVVVPTAEFAAPTRMGSSILRAAAAHAEPVKASVRPTSLPPREEQRMDFFRLVSD